MGARDPHAVRETGEAATRRAVGHLIDDVRRHYRGHPEILALPRGPRGRRHRQRRGVPRRSAAARAPVAAGRATRRWRGVPALPGQPARRPRGLGRCAGRVRGPADAAEPPGACRARRPARCAHHRLHPHPAWRAAPRQRRLRCARARRLLAQPFAWEDLKRALRARELRIESLGDRLGMSTVSLEPEPIPLDAKVVLVGDRLVYYLLAAYDPDFLELFKVQADFEDEVPRNPEHRTAVRAAARHDRGARVHAAARARRRGRDRGPRGPPRRRRAAPVHAHAPRHRSPPRGRRPGGEGGPGGDHGGGRGRGRGCPVAARGPNPRALARGDRAGHDARRDGGRGGGRRERPVGRLAGRGRIRSAIADHRLGTARRG